MKALYEIMDTIEENVAIFIDEYDNIQRIKILDELKNIGYSTDNNNVIGINNKYYYMHHSKNFMLKDTKNILDNLVGHSVKWNETSSIGWNVLGSKNDNKPKVVILGGSTSTADLYTPETWMMKLYKKLNRLNLGCIFYLGAAQSYRIIDEFLKFLRDGHIIKPDIVISMSGVNDLYLDVFENKFNLKLDLERKFIADRSEFFEGISSEENCYEYWLRIEKMFKMYVNSLNAEFFSFLQPINTYTPNATIECKMMNEYEIWYVGAKKFAMNAIDKEIYKNLIGLFYNKPEMFIDIAHYSDKGADVLSDKVLETILPTIKELYARK